MGGGDGGSAFRCNMIRRRLRASVGEEAIGLIVVIGAGATVEECMVAIEVVIVVF